MTTMASRVRSVLTDEPNGLTTNEIAKRAGITTRNLRHAINDMYDVISIGSVPGKNGSAVKVWFLVQAAKHDPIAPVAKHEGPPRTVWVGGVPKWKWN